MSTEPAHRFEPGWFGWRTFDARGRCVRIPKYFHGVDRTAFHFRAINRWKNARVQDWAAADDTMHGVWYQFVNAALAIVVAMPFLLYVIVLPWINISPSFLVIAFLLMLTIVLGSLSRSQFKPPHRQVDALLRDGACPSCLHNMEGARKESDGCTACPECGAAWRITTRSDAATSQLV